MKAVEFFVRLFFLSCFLFILVFNQQTTTNCSIEICPQLETAWQRIEQIENHLTDALTGLAKCQFQNRQEQNNYNGTVERLEKSINMLQLCCNGTATLTGSQLNPRQTGENEICPETIDNLNHRIETLENTIKIIMLTSSADNC